MPQLAVARPLGEGDLGNELWPHPMDAAARHTIGFEGIDGRPQFGELPAQSTQCLVIP